MLDLSRCTSIWWPGYLSLLVRKLSTVTYYQGGALFRSKRQKCYFQKTLSRSFVAARHREQFWFERFTVYFGNLGFNFLLSRLPLVLSSRSREIHHLRLVVLVSRTPWTILSGYFVVEVHLFIWIGILALADSTRIAWMLNPAILSSFEVLKRVGQFYCLQTHGSWSNRYFCLWCDFSVTFLLVCF